MMAFWHTMKFALVVCKLVSVISIHVSYQYFSHELTLMIVGFSLAIFVWIQDHVEKENEEFEDSEVEFVTTDDSFDWLNEIIATIWNNYREFAESNLRTYCWPSLRDELMDVPFRNIWKDVILDTCYIGDQTPKIKKIESWSLNNDLFFSLSLSFDSNAFFRIIFATKHLQFPMTLENIIVKKANIRLVLKDFQWKIPFASGIHFAFVEHPIYDWDLKHLAGIADIDGFDELILDMLNHRITQRVILPRMLIIPCSLSETMQEFLMKYLPEEFIKKQVKTKELMLEPFIILKATVIQGICIEVKQSWRQDCQNFLSTDPSTKLRLKVTLGELTNETEVNAESDIWDFVSIFPVQHIYEQQVIISVSDLQGRLIGTVKEDLSRIADLNTFTDEYGFEGSKGGLRVCFESLPLTNQRTAILESRPYGVLSIFLQHLLSPEEAIRPVIHLELRQKSEKTVTWSSLKPLVSKRTHYMNEGTMMLINDVLDDTTKLSIKLWDSRNGQWIGHKQGILVKNFLQKPAEKLRVKFESVKLAFAVSLYHL